MKGNNSSSTDFMFNGPIFFIACPTCLSSYIRDECFLKAFTFGLALHTVWKRQDCTWWWIKKNPEIDPLIDFSYFGDRELSL